jgi:hypothetical protein
MNRVLIDMNAKRFRVLVTGLVLVFLLVVPHIASADGTPTCSARNVSGLIGTTCDIGNLQFTFTAFASQNRADTLGPSPVNLYNSPLSSAEFSFVPVDGGFTLIFDGGAQTLSAPAGVSAAEDAELHYTVSVTDPLAEHLVNESVTGGVISVSGSTFAVAGYNGLTDASADDPGGNVGENVQVIEVGGFVNTSG